MDDVTVSWKLAGSRRSWIITGSRYKPSEVGQMMKKDKQILPASIRSKMMKWLLLTGQQLNFYTRYILNQKRLSLSYVAFQVLIKKSDIKKDKLPVVKMWNFHHLCH